MFLRKIRQKVYTLRLDCIVKSDSSLSEKAQGTKGGELDCIVKSDSSLSSILQEAKNYSLIVL